MVRILGREQPRRDNCSSDQVNDSNAGPHQRRRHTAGPQEQKTQAGAVPRNKPGRPRGRKRQEIRKGYRTARWRGIDTKGSTTLTNSRTVGLGRTTGHQKRIPDVRNEACSIPCHISDCRPSANNEGMCHPISVAEAASQQSVGFASVFPSRFMGAQREIGARNATNRWGKPCASGFTRRAKPYERRSQRHEQQMLNHVDCEQLVVEGSYR